MTAKTFTQQLRKTCFLNPASSMMSCIEEMWKFNAEDKWNFHFDKVGRWWNGNTEIDIVALDSTGNDIILGECKYCILHQWLFR